MKMILMRIFNKNAVLCLILLCGLISINVFANEISVELRAETWDMPRHGEILLKDPALATIVKQWLKNQQQKIELRYPGGEEGELWVEELSDWLVSLGIPGNSILISPGSDAQDVINIVLIEAVIKP